MSHHDSAMPGCDKADNFLRYDQHSATGANVAEHPRDWANLAGRLQSNESLITNGTQVTFLSPYHNLAQTLSTQFKFLML